MLPRIISPTEVTWPSGGSLYNHQIAAQWAIHVEPMPGAWPTPSQRNLQQLTDRLIGDPADRGRPILLDGLIGCAAPQAIVAARAAGARVVLLVHLPLPAETGASRSQVAGLARAEQHALTAAEAVACTSHWAAADLRRRYGVTGITVAEPGVVAAPPATGSDPPVFITPAVFSARKNHALLLRAFADAQIADLDWSALWVGAEPAPGARRAVQQQVAMAGLADRIDVKAAVTGSQLDALYARSNLLLLPSLAETYAMVVTEAFARGIPAVVGAGTGAAATLAARRDNGRGHRDLPGGNPPGRDGAESGLPGTAVGLEDPRVWAQTLRSWLTDRSLRATWREAAMTRREDQPTWADAAHTLIRVMQSKGA
ncbi:MAG: glycosyltransferase family 4 protein [Ornithinimicrobium sp.]